MAPSRRWWNLFSHIETQVAATYGKCGLASELRKSVLAWNVAPYQLLYDAGILAADRAWATSLSDPKRTNRNLPWSTRRMPYAPGRPPRPRASASFPKPTK